VVKNGKKIIGKTSIKVRDYGEKAEQETVHLWHSEDPADMALSSQAALLLPQTRPQPSPTSDTRARVFSSHPKTCIPAPKMYRFLL